MSFRVPHPLRSADQDREGDRRRVRGPLSAAHNHDTGNPASSNTLEAIGERKLILFYLLPMGSLFLPTSDVKFPTIQGMYQEGTV